MIKKTKTEVPKKIIVTFGGDKMSGKSSLMNLLIKELTKNKIKYTADPEQHMLCVETKRQEIVDLIHTLKNKKQ